MCMMQSGLRFSKVSFNVEYEDAGLVQQIFPLVTGMAINHAVKTQFSEPNITLTYNNSG